MLLLPLHCCSASQLCCSARTAAELTSLRRLTVRAEVNSVAVRAEAQCGVFVSCIFRFVLGVHSMDRFAAACPLRSDRAGDVVVSHSTLRYAPLLPPSLLAHNVCSFSRRSCWFLIVADASATAASHAASASMGLPSHDVTAPQSWRRPPDKPSQRPLLVIPCDWGP